MESEHGDEKAGPFPPAAEVEAAFAALPAEARAALWLHVVERVAIGDVAESLRLTTEGAAFLMEGGAARIAEQLQKRGWGTVRAEGLASLLASLPPSEPPAGLCQRIRERCGRYFD